MPAASRVTIRRANTCTLRLDHVTYQPSTLLAGMVCSVGYGALKDERGYEEGCLRKHSNNYKNRQFPIRFIFGGVLSSLFRFLLGRF